MQLTVQCLIGAVMVAATILIQAGGTTWWVRHLMRCFVQARSGVPPAVAMRVLVSTGTVLVGLHTVQIGLWAVVYRFLPTAADLPSNEAAIYFSFVTFTTLGYGDVTLGEGWRVLSGIEAMNGILLVGWSTAVLFAAVQRIWQAGAGAGEAGNVR